MFPGQLVLDWITDNYVALKLLGSSAEHLLDILKLNTLFY